MAVGEYMLTNEKLVQENDQFELAFDQSSGHLVCRSLTDHNNESPTSMNESEKDHLQSIIARNIDIIWLHRFQAVFSNQINSIVNTIYSMNNLSSYKFCVEWESANYQIKTL